MTNYVSYCNIGNILKPYVHLMYIGPCIILIVEEQETNLISLVIKFYFTSSIINMFRTLIH